MFRSPSVTKETLDVFQKSHNRYYSLKIVTTSFRTTVIPVSLMNTAAKENNKLVMVTFDKQLRKKEMCQLKLKNIFRHCLFLK